MWEQLGNDLVTASIKCLLPILITFIIGWVGLLIKTEWDNIAAKRPDIIELVKQYAPYLVAYLEQMRKNNKIDLWTIEAETERLIIEFLKTRGVTLDLGNPIWILIKTIIEAEVNKLPSFDSVITTKSVSVVESTPAKVVPMKTSAKVLEVPTVVTTTSTTVSSDSVVVAPEVPVVVPSSDGSVG